MKKYNLDKTIDRRKTHSYKWDCGPDEISLSIADTDFEVLPEIKKALLARVKEGRYGYTAPYDEYFEAYKKWFGSRYNAKFEISDCIYCTSIVAALDSAVRRVTKENDGVLLLTPVYNVFFNVIKNNNRKLVDCPLHYENYQYSIDWELLEKKMKEAKAIIFCNPHNPVGMMFSREDILKIVELCKKNDVYLLSDEIHCDLDYNKDRYVSALAVTDYSKLITFLSPGKTFNLAGLHSSIMVIKDKDLREIIQKGVYEDDVGEPNYFSIAPVIAAYTHGDAYVIALNAYLEDNREFVRTFLKENLPHLHLIDNKATYLLWIDISETNKDSDIFTKQLIEKAGLVVCPGSSYGDNRFIRINIATSRKILLDGLERLKRYCEQ